MEIYRIPKKRQHDNQVITQLSGRHRNVRKPVRKKYLTNQTQIEAIDKDKGNHRFKNGLEKIMKIEFGILFRH